MTENLNFKIPNLPSTKPTLQLGDENFIQDLVSDRMECTVEQIKKMAREKNLISMLRSEEKLIILIDIVSFSKNDSKRQFANIFVFQNYVRSFIFSRRFSFKKSVEIENFIPTGDGCYMIAEKCEPHVAINFLVTMISGFQSLKDFDDNPFSIRASALIGECIPFMDLAHHKNFVGEGMNEAERILSSGRQRLEEKFMDEGSSEDEAKMKSKNSLFLGESLYGRSKSLNLKKIIESEEHLLLNDVTDKHGKVRDVLVLHSIQEK